MNDTTWKLTDIYATEEEFSDDLKKARKLLEQIAELKGKLNTEKAILKCYQYDEQLGMIFDKLYVIRYLKKDQKLDDKDANKNFQEIMAFSNDIEVKMAFIDPEILQNSEEFINNMMEKEPGLKCYEREIQRLIRTKSHVLSVEVEEVISSFSRPLNAFRSIYRKLVDADFEYQDAVDSAGKKLKMTNAKADVYLQSSDRTLRKSAFESRLNEYKKYAHTISEMYISAVQKFSIESKLKKYPSYFEQCMDVTESNVKVYNSLIEAVNKYLPINHEYFALRKQLLGYDKMNHYDNLVQLLFGFKSKYTYEQAKELILKALAPLGKEYIQDLQNAFESSWTDVYERDKKRSGAYSIGVYGVHPYVLQNYNGIYNSISTVAHEFGHAMHSYYSNQTQSFQNSNYRIMVAETVSTVNEMLLAEYMIENETDKEKKVVYIIEQLKKINGSLVRQTMFAEFEKWVHEEIRKGNELTCEDISEYYYALVKKYFGDSIEANELLKYEWARIPHFYRPFYVYQYATGLSAGIYIAMNILERGEEYSHKYIEMLHMGGCMPPLDELRHVEVNLETDEPVKKAFEFYKCKVDLLRKLTDEIAKEKEILEK